MVRPRLASDEEILTAAAEVLAERGSHGFTLTEVASRVGLSRAAIILRFKGAEELKSSLITQMVRPFIQKLDAIELAPGGDGLIAVAEHVGSHIKSREGSAQFFAGYGANVQDRTMVALERARGDALKNAVSRAMPKVAIDHHSAVALFTGHLGGCVLAWLSMDDADAKAVLRTRTQEWLKLVGIPYSQTSTADPWEAEPAKAAARGKNTKTAAKKTVLASKRARQG